MNCKFSYVHDYKRNLPKDSEEKELNSLSDFNNKFENAGGIHDFYLCGKEMQAEVAGKALECLKNKQFFGHLFSKTNKYITEFYNKNF